MEDGVDLLGGPFVLARLQLGEEGAVGEPARGDDQRVAAELVDMGVCRARQLAGARIGAPPVTVAEDRVGAHGDLVAGLDRVHPGGAQLLDPLLVHHPMQVGGLEREVGVVHRGTQLGDDGHLLALVGEVFGDARAGVVALGLQHDDPVADILAGHDLLRRAYLRVARVDAGDRRVGDAAEPVGRPV